MKRTVRITPRETTARQALRRRVDQFYREFNSGNWEKCYSLIDPRLTERQRVKIDRYCELMQVFKAAYGSVNLEWKWLSLHLKGAPKQDDNRPFAYVYVIWQDKEHGFHMFRERWVQDRGQWFTRVVGLVPNRQPTDSRQE
jgi:hypothetical protein